MLDLRLVQGATVLPVDLDVARQHLRQDQEADDLMIGLYLRAAVDSVQDMTGRALMRSTWEYRARSLDCCSVRLPLAPLISVESVTVDGAALTADDYEVIAPSGATCGRGWITTEATWPSGPAVVKFVAGYPSKDAVPAALQAAVLLALGSLYENREAEAEKSGSTARMLAENPAYMRLLRPYMLIG